MPKGTFQTKIIATFELHELRFGIVERENAVSAFYMMSSILVILNRSV